MMTARWVALLATMLCLCGCSASAPHGGMGGTVLIASDGAGIVAIDMANGCARTVLGWGGSAGPSCPVTALNDSVIVVTESPFGRHEAVVGLNWQTRQEVFRVDGLGGAVTRGGRWLAFFRDGTDGAGLLIRRSVAGTHEDTVIRLMPHEPTEKSRDGIHEKSWRSLGVVGLLPVGRDSFLMARPEGGVWLVDAAVPRLTQTSPNSLRPRAWNSGLGRAICTKEDGAAVILSLDGAETRVPDRDGGVGYAFTPTGDLVICRHRPGFQLSEAWDVLLFQDRSPTPITIRRGLAIWDGIVVRRR